MGKDTVNMPFQTGLIGEVDKAASRRKDKWTGIFATGRKTAKDNAVTPGDVEREISAYRKGKS